MGTGNTEGSMSLLGTSMHHSQVQQRCFKVELGMQGKPTPGPCLGVCECSRVPHQQNLSGLGSARELSRQQGFIPPMQ